jgi:predicted PurR-regulated permease PerM
MVVVGVVFSIAWSIIGLPGALVLGIIAGFLTLIPDVGPFIAAILACSVALLEGSSWIVLPNLGVAVIVMVVYLVLIAIKNFWLRPFIMGRSVHMPEVLVFIFIIMATVLWGILGALLVIPVVASLMIIFDYLRRRILGMPPFPDEIPLSKPRHPKREPLSRLFKKRAKDREKQ